MVNDKGFRDLVAALDPSYQLPSRDYLSQQFLPQLYESALEDMSSILSKTEYITLTTDAWTSITTEGYIAVTPHAISDDLGSDFLPS